VSPERALTFETGVRYQMYHAFGLMIIGILIANWPTWQVTWQGGRDRRRLLIFSGSLYVLVLTDTPWLGRDHADRRRGVHRRWALLAWGALVSSRDDWQANEKAAPPCGDAASKVERLVRRGAGIRSLRLPRTGG
jgi:hypothetical protein